MNIQNPLPPTPLPPSDARSALPAKEYLDHLRKINDVFYDQIRIADQKAAYIFTFLLAFMISSAEGRSVFAWKRYVDGEPLLVIVSALLAVSVSLSLVSAILVVLPRVRTTATSLFWGGWSVNRSAFLEAARSDDPDYLFHEYLGNVDNLSAIARTKYRYVGLAFRALVVTVLAYVLLLGL